MVPEKIKELLKKYGQEHLTGFCGELGDEERKALFKQIEGIDFAFDPTVLTYPDLLLPYGTTHSPSLRPVTISVRRPSVAPRVTGRFSYSSWQ